MVVLVLQDKGLQGAPHTKTLLTQIQLTLLTLLTLTLITLLQLEEEEVVVVGEVVG